MLSLKARELQHRVHQLGGELNPNRERRGWNLSYRIRGTDEWTDDFVSTLDEVEDIVSSLEHGE